ncbi:hypothetical protein [Helicobacter cappadocius]|uniref:Uncharacterized protein n=1 Tax=Helicobacter cappadocius TaxID=3063998 RepID=A0AA90TEN5_9HELI|nr:MULTISPECIES: hypothetical protein [unclassified Helicobacter]MDO7253069.1 hypothetical protein [Helicobacter sp. faydin-H75]MDP2538805.1 hypothetical protein [Helicobacter sp. faydin-H76]
MSENEMKQKIDNSKKHKLIDGKKIFFVLDPKAYESLKNNSKENSLTMTKFLEKMLLEKSQENNENVSRIFALTKLNKGLYEGTNATYSNINQIAYSLNIQKLLDGGEINDLSKIDLKNISVQLQNLCNDITSLRILILEFLLILDNNGIETKKIKNKLQKYKNQIKKEDQKISQENTNV